MKFKEEIYNLKKDLALKIEEIQIMNLQNINLQNKIKKLNNKIIVMKQQIKDLFEHP